MQVRKRSGASHKHVVIRGEKQALSQGRAAVREVTGDVGRRQLVIRAQVRSPFVKFNSSQVSGAIGRLRVRLKIRQTLSCF